MSAGECWSMAWSLIDQLPKKGWWLLAPPLGGNNRPHPAEMHDNPHMAQWFDGSITEKVMTPTIQKANRQEFDAYTPSCHILDRVDTKLLYEIAPTAKFFLKTTAALLEYVVGDNPGNCCCLGWQRRREGVYRKSIGDHILWVVESPYGWTMQRDHHLDTDADVSEVMACSHGPWPLLAPDHKSAIRLAEACQPDGAIFPRPLDWLKL
jgi:hypothetical protein